MLVRIRDFQRIQKRIEDELTPRHENIPAAYFALFGATLATGAAVPSLFTASGLATWIIPTFIVSASAFLVLGVVLVIVARALRSGQGKAASEIAQEMREIETPHRGERPITSAARSRSRDVPESH